MSRNVKQLQSPIFSATLCASFTEKEIEPKASTSNELQPSTSKDPKSG